MKLLFVPIIAAVFSLPGNRMVTTDPVHEGEPRPLLQKLKEERHMARVQALLEIRALREEMMLLEEKRMQLIQRIPSRPHAPHQRSIMPPRPIASADEDQCAVPVRIRVHHNANGPARS